MIDSDCIAVDSDYGTRHRLTAYELRQYARSRKTPTMATLERWEENGVAKCTGACKCPVELDGTCPNGYPSWLLELGMI